MIYRFIFFTVICFFSDCFAAHNVFTVNSGEGGVYKQECTTVQDILRCKSASFEYNNATIKADNIYSHVIIDGIAMIKFIVDLNDLIRNGEQDSAILNACNVEYSLSGLSCAFGRSLKKVLNNSAVSPSIKKLINSNFFMRQLTIRVCITGGGANAFLDKLKLQENYESILSVIDSICEEAVKTQSDPQV